MRIGRTLPPAATPISMSAMASGVHALFRGRKELDRFEAELKAEFGKKHCFLVSSGKAAFALALLALKELSPERDEVLIPAFTCFSVPSAIVRAGLRVKLCDLEAGSLDFDFTQLSRILGQSITAESGGSRANPSDKTPVFDSAARDNADDPSGKILAVVPTHMFGYPADVVRVQRLVQDSGIAVVEDAAQAMGETHAQGVLGTLGDISFFSLARGKAFSTVEGGVILTDREDVAAVLERLVRRRPGYSLISVLKLAFKAMALMVLAHPNLFWVPRSIPMLKLGETLFETDFPILRMSSFQAGLARNWRRKLPALQNARKRKVGKWIARFGASGAGGVRVLSHHASALLRLPVVVSDTGQKEFLLTESSREGLGIMPVYPTSIDAIPELKGKTDRGRYPVAAACASDLLTLPTHGYLSDRDVDKISHLISRAPQ